MVLQLREAIQSDGRTLTELAEASGLDAGRLSRFVRGQRDITFDAASRLADALGITFNLPIDKAAVPAKKPGRGKK